MAFLRSACVLSRVARCPFRARLFASTTRTETNNPETGKGTTGFSAFYRFPYIVAARTVQRAKLYQTVLTVTYAPAAVFLHHSGAVSLLNAQATVAAAAFAVVMLYVVGNFFDRFVGALYLDRDRGETLRVAHLTFWGHRRDVDIPIGLVLPLGPADSRGLVTVRRMDSDETFRVMFRFGGIVDREAFEYVFGKNL